MINKYIKISVWLLGALATATAHTATESALQSVGVPTNSQTLPAFSEPVLAPISEGVSLDIVPDATYSPPAFSRQIKLNIYPMEALRKGHEGWVQLSMMVDKQGKPYEISVVDSAGSPAFEKAAIRAMGAHQFKPATLNGEPVDAGYAFKFKFVLAGVDKGASNEFVRQYKALSAALQRSDRTAADAVLTSMKAQNLYEDSFYNLGRFFYFRLWGDDKQRLEALRHAIAYENRSKFLPEKDFQLALAEQFELQLRVKDFAGALQTFDYFDAEKKSNAGYLQTIASIKALAKDASAYAVQGEITIGTSWFYRPLKQHFSILVSEGKLAEIKLRCERKYVLVEYQPDMDYAIPEDYGVCDMELVGDNGTKFTLIQS